MFLKLGVCRISQVDRHMNFELVVCQCLCMRSSSFHPAKLQHASSGIVKGREIDHFHQDTPFVKLQVIFYIYHKYSVYGNNDI